MIPIDIEISAIDYGFSTWNPKHYQVPWIRGRTLSFDRKAFSKCAKNRLTLDEVRECLKLNQPPPKLRDISDTNRILTNEPLVLPKGARQNINHNEKPHAWTCAIPLYVAQQGGCNLDQIDFFLCGKRVLSTLYERHFNQAGDYLRVQIKKGILILAVCNEDTTRKSDKNDVGHQYERFVQEGTFSEISNLEEARNVRELCLGGHKVLVSAKVDCIDDNGDPVETKLNDFFQDSMKSEQYSLKRAMDLLLTMISNGSVGAVLGNRKWNEWKCTLNSVQSYSLEYVLDYVQSKTYNLEEFKEQLNTENLFQPVIDSLNELKQYVCDGTISNKPNSYYKISFNNSEKVDKKEIVIEPINMKGTVDYCSEYLYDALLDDHGFPKDLDTLVTKSDLVVSHVGDEYKSCECNESSLPKETPKRWKRNCDFSRIGNGLLKLKIAD